MRTSKPTCAARTARNLFARAAASLSWAVARRGVSRERGGASALTCVELDVPEGTSEEHSSTFLHSCTDKVIPEEDSSASSSSYYFIAPRCPRLLARSSWRLVAAPAALISSPLAALVSAIPPTPAYSAAQGGLGNCWTPARKLRAGVIHVGQRRRLGYIAFGPRSPSYSPPRDHITEARCFSGYPGDTRPPIRYL